MDTAEVAAKIGTTPRVLRQFLRSAYSTYVAVGSGGRYDFNEKDVTTIEKRFAEWLGNGRPKPIPVGVTVSKKAPRRAPQPDQVELDQAVWAEEGPVVLEDIRDPRVRRRVRADARAAEERLMFRLLAKGLHVAQLGDRAS